MAIKQPADKSHFILPDLGEGVHEAELIRWRVEVGHYVKEHQILAEMETDKALVEVPSPWSGVISKLCGQEGDIINVGSVLVEYETEGKPRRETDETQAGAEQAAEAEPDAEAEEDAGTVVGSVGGALSISDRFRRRPEAEETSTATGRPLATPAVRRLARELGVDLRLVSGTGRGGRITAGDVRQAASSAEEPEPAEEVPARSAPAPSPAPAPAPAAPAAPVSAGDDVTQRIPFRGVRRKIAEALHHSVQTTVHFTAVDEADVTALDAKRREYASILGRKLSLLPFVMVAVCRALRQHPQLNANVDDENGEILLRGTINLGCAVDTEHGLMVPVIGNADRLSIVQLAESVTSLAKQCRNRSIAREQLTGGTFTISNVGSYGGMFATPIINYPEVAILAAGRTKERVMTRDGTFYAGQCLPLSLSCDHRVVDGAEGVRFLNTVVQLLQSPESIIRGF
ncbi:MAG: dihydrolipoamide acetyltransferase family protein [Planctomycetota bacterium]|nr:dihydrolipoamide acetyltransferase family protein [Planctomycetota bacterium]